MSISNPQVDIQIIPASQVSQDEEQKVLVLGQMTSVGTATSGDLVENIGNNNDQNALFGENSIAANMVYNFKRINKISRIDAIPLDDDGSAVKATGSVSFTSGPSTETTTIEVIVGSKANHAYTISIADTDVVTDIGDALEAAITADKKCPVTAVNVAGVVTFTAVNAGTEGNLITIKVIGTIAGVTIASVAMASGATNPSLTNVLDVVDNVRYQTIIFPESYIIDDTGNNIYNFLEARWNPGVDKIMDGIGITAFTNTLASLKSSTTVANSKNFCIIANEKVSETDYNGSALLELDYNIASQFAAIRSLRLTTGAAISNFVDATEGAKDAFGGMHISTLPYHNTPFTFLPIIDTGYMWTDDEREELKNVGFTILGNNVAKNTIILDSVVTRYLTDAAGDTDLSFKFLNYVDQSSVTREYFHNNLKREFKQTRLTEGKLVAGYNMANSGIIRAACMRIIGELADMAIVQAGEAARKKFLSKLEISIDEINGLITIIMIDPVVSQLRKIDATMKLVFSINE